MFQLPKGRSFSKRVYATGALLAIFLFLLATYFFVHNADKGISKQAKPEIDSEHAREAIKRIKQQKPAGSVVNTAITKKSLEFATHQPAEFTPGDIVYLDGKAYWVNDHGQIIPLTEAGFKPGDIVYKDGKPYIVDANGQLKPFNGALQPGQRVYQNGKWYEVDALGKLVPITAGTIAKINGEDVIFKDGKWVPLTEAGFKPGDIVYKDGKPYIVDANGQLKPFNGALQPGQRVYQNGKWYEVDELGNLIPMKEGTITEVNGKPFVLKDGQWVPLAELGLKAGDIVYKDGEAFVIGEDGKLTPIDQLKPGQVVYKDGQFWQVDEAGNLIKLDNGSLVLDSKSRPYSLKDNALVKPDPCTVVHDENGKVLIVGHDHKLHLLSEGDSCFNESLGEGIKIQDGKVIHFSGKKSTTAKSVAAGQKHHQSAKTSSSDGNPPLDQKSKSLWQVNMDQSTETIAAMKAPIEVIRYQKSEKQTAHKKELTFEEAMAKEQADIKSLLAAQQNSNPYTMQNNQSSKIAFLKAAQQKSDGALDSMVQSSNYPYTLSVGSFIPATLISGINLKTTQNFEKAH